MGNLEDEQGRLAAAEAAYRAALALEPDRSSLHNNLGYNLLLQGQGDAAVTEIRRAIELDPKSEIAHNNLGAALISQGRPIPEEALSEWQRRGGPAVAHNNMAAVLMEQGRWAEARAEIEAALGYRRDLPAALGNLRALAEQDGQPGAALRVADAGRRHASIWSRAYGIISRLKKAVRGAEKSGPESARSAISGGQASPLRVAAAGRK